MTTTTWRCGHPRIPYNTHGGTERTHAQCWTCRRASQRKADRRYDARVGGLLRSIQKNQAAIRRRARDGNYQAPDGARLEVTP